MASCLWATLVLAPGCSGDEELAAAVRALGEGCLLDSDCSGDLVCVFRRCHVQCETTEDCRALSLDTECRLGDRPTNVCLLPDEVACDEEKNGEILAIHSACPPLMVCGPDLECRDPCADDSACLPRQRCLKGVCADENTDDPALTSEDPQAEGATCSYNSQCVSPLVCLQGFCNEECRENVDCPTGQVCAEAPTEGFDTPPMTCQGGPGTECLYNSDCTAPLTCRNGNCVPECTTDVDCGGGRVCVELEGNLTCVPGCTYTSDCASPLICDGGGCVPECAADADCTVPKTCEDVGGTLACVDTTAAPATCFDGTQNGAETDIDCGGGACPPCAVAGTCTGDTDCATGKCDAGTCAAPTCTDGVQNGLETGIDCGGGCPGCTMGGGCTQSADCSSGLCQMGVCVTPSCTDGTQNGDETDVDCGGSCGACMANGDCQVGSDCVDGVCAGGTCQMASCSDGVLNGTESGIDCGGGCDLCGVGAACNAGTDCGSGSCPAGTCLAPTCSDGTQNGDELGVDCGGSCLAGCGAGTTCTVNNDCAVGTGCLNGTCTAQYTVTVTTSGAGFGFVDSLAPKAGAIENCTGCSTLLYDGETISLTATAVNASSFTGWTGACTGTGPCDITIAGANVTVDAAFASTASPTTADYQMELPAFNTLIWDDAAVASDGDVVVVGYGGGTQNFGGSDLSSEAGFDNTFITRQDPSLPWDAGGHQWSVSFNTDANPARVVLDAAGDVIVIVTADGADPVIGGTAHTCPTEALVLIKLDGATGAYMTSACLGTGGTSIIFDPREAKLHPSGDLVIAGSLSANGVLDFGGVSLDPNGDDVFVARIDASTLAVNAAKVLGGSGNQSGMDVDVDDAGDIYVTGTCNDTTDFGDGVVITPPLSAGNDPCAVKLQGVLPPPVGDPPLKTLWGFQEGGTGFSSDGSNAGAILANGNLLVSSYFAAQLDFTDGCTLPNAGATDIALIEIDAASGSLLGNLGGGSSCDGVITFGSTGDEAVEHMAVVDDGGANDGDLYITVFKTFGPSLDLGNGGFTGRKVVARFSDFTGTPTWSIGNQDASTGNNLSFEALTLDGDAPVITDRSAASLDWGLGQPTATTYTFRLVP